MSKVITIPYKFEPRSYQKELFTARDNGFRRLISIYHRRAGKDKTMFNLIIRESLKRVGVYYYFFPEYAQGRRVIWDGIDGSGFKFLDHIPSELIQSKNSTDMRIVLTNGSVIQIMGTDKFDKVRGSNPVGCVFSEFAFQNPKAWNIIRPILAENGGWAAFNSSVNGKNHFYDLTQMALKNINWFVQNYTVEQTLDENGNRYVSDEVIQEERDSGMSEEMIQQEFYNSWISNSQGFYYLSIIDVLEREGRICNLPHNPTAPVETWWDIGVGDYTSIWFTQSMGKDIHVIDYYTSNTKGMDHYAKVLQSKNYVYRSHNFPHDMINIEFGTGKTRYEVAEELFKGIRLNIVPKLKKEDGRNAVRMILPQCYFDKSKCNMGLDGLKNYRKAWDDKNQVYKDEDVHDWAADPADAFRYLAVGISLPRSRSFKSEFMKSNIRTTNTRNWRTA
ncbi:large subunit terminase [Caudoviricetes sp.]|nr:large subunit terminase [Caudoviricetes sp.]